MMWQLGLLGESGEAPGSISGAANAGAPAGGSSSLREAASPRR
jgi:hypothetical protein